MGLFDSIKNTLVKAKETFVESQERRHLRSTIKRKILHRFSMRQLKTIAVRYGDGGPYRYEIHPLTNERTYYHLTAEDYVDFIDSNITLETVKEFATLNKIKISDILNEERVLLREIDDKWGSRKSDTDDNRSSRGFFFEQVIETIEKFEPSSAYRNEQGYHSELQGWMKAHFSSAEVEHQTGSSRPDIVIDKRIAIEVKGPTRSQDLKTIADKCNRYLQYYDNLIVVLFEVDVNERFYNEWLNGIESRYSEVVIIRK